MTPYLPTIELRDGSEAVLLEDLEMTGDVGTRHVRTVTRATDMLDNSDGQSICVACRQKWPCDAAEAVANYRASLAAEADDVRYAGGGGTSDYWRGFNDGIDRLAERLIEGDTDARER